MTTKITDSKTVQETTTASNISTTNSRPFVNQQSASLSQNVAQTVTNLPAVAPDWTNRRYIIFLSMYFIFSAFGIIVAAVAFVLLHNTLVQNHGVIDGNIISLAQSMIYMLGFLATSIIGSYCFSASYEHINYRQSLTDMVAKIATAGSSLTRDPSTNPSNNPAPATGRDPPAVAAAEDKSES